jgi:hypothetical protein
MHVVYQLGADTSQIVYGVLSKRAGELMLDGWQLEVETSSDSAVVVDREGTRTIVEVSECWDVVCVAAGPPTGRPGTEEKRSL